MLWTAASGLVLLTTPGHRSHATGKLFEYLAARRPILALALDSAAAKIVNHCVSGVEIDQTDPAAIAQAMVSAANGKLEWLIGDQQRLAAYLYPGPAIQVEQLIELAISNRQTTA